MILRIVRELIYRRRYLAKQMSFQSLTIMTLTVRICFKIDTIGFPIIPIKGAKGAFEGHEYFVYENVSRDLKSIISDNTLHVSRDDLVNIAIQILTILQYLFEKGMVLNNLTIDDFILRRTTRGYRVILLNQDFYSGELVSINDTTFVSPSILHGNGRTNIFLTSEPTMRDNVISAVYVMLYLINCTLFQFELKDSNFALDGED